MKILFTGYYFDSYHGSMMHICEIGKYLKSLGHEIYIASCIIEDKIVKYTSELGLNLYSAQNLPLNIHYDIVWTYHFPLLPYLIERGIKYNKVINGCLSGLLHPLETPIFVCKNYNIPILVNSEETKLNLSNAYPDFKDKISVLVNSVPDEFLEYKRNDFTRKLKKIAIISNHIPDEIISIVSTFKRMKIKVDIYGIEYKQALVTPQLLSDYDVIVTIGKTVQYALMMGIPVYNYDYMGGSGYIRLNNIDNEEFYNFSGRSHSRKLTFDDIICEIMAYYEETLNEMQQIQKIAEERYLLSKNINKVLDMIETLPNLEIKMTDDNKLLFTQYNFLFNQILNLRLKHNKHIYTHVQSAIKLSYFKYRVLANIPFLRKTILPIKQEYKILLDNIKEK